jgi:hypothetical protein
MITLLLIFNARLHPSLNVPGLKGEFKENSSQGGTLLSEISFTPLESPVACSGDEGNFLMAANTGFNAPCERSR